MSVITETLLRSEFKRNIPKRYEIDKNTILTPSAKQYLKEQQIEIVDVEVGREQDKRENQYKKFEKLKGDFQPKFISNYDGGMYEEKPEFMTHISGNKLVFKDDNRIVFRGKLDSLQSCVLKAQYQLLEHDELQLSENLEDVLTLIRKILRAEVMDEELEDIKLFGLSFDQIRKHSHAPKEHYGISHFMPTVDMGYPLIELNDLRTMVRETEIAAMKAFRKDLILERNDLIQALNRMSSGIYVLMCRFKSGFYLNKKR